MGELYGAVYAQENAAESSRCGMRLGLLRRAFSLLPRESAHFAGAKRGRFCSSCVSVLICMGCWRALRGSNSRRRFLRAYCTVTVTVACERPYWLVAYKVYVVVWPGVTATLVPRTGPTWGDMMR